MVVRVLKVGQILDPVLTSAECILENGNYTMWVLNDRSFCFCVLDKYDRYLVLVSFFEKDLPVIKNKLRKGGYL